MPLLAEKAMHSERCHACLYTEEVKGILLSKGEGIEELPESVANLSPALGSPDPAQDSQITVLMGNHISLSIVSKGTLVTNGFMHGLDSCNILYPLELTAMTTGNQKLMIAYDVPYVRQEKETQRHNPPALADFIKIPRYC